MKKYIALLLTLTLLATIFVGCGKKPTETPANSSETPANSSEALVGTTTWPEKPITVIIPYNPGGDTDFNARAYLEYLSADLGVAVVATNVAGSSGTIASRQVKDAANDGYTVLFSHTAMNVNEMVGIAEFGMDAFEISCIAARSPGEIIAVRSDLGVKTLDELKAYTEAHPGELDLAIDFGTMVNINGIQMQKEGFDVNLITAGSASERVAALAGGHCDIIINGFGSVKDYLATGEFVALGTIGTEQAEGFNGIPTALEQGYDINLDKHYFFAFPKGTPTEIVEKFAASVEKASQNADYQAAIMTAYAQEPFYASPKDGLALMQDAKDKIWSFKADMAG